MPGAVVARAEPAASPWRQPVIWLALGIFTASLAGCILMVVLALQGDYDDGGARGTVIFKVPVDRQPDPPR